MVVGVRCIWFLLPAAASPAAACALWDVTRGVRRPPGPGYARAVTAPVSRVT